MIDTREINPTALQHIYQKMLTANPKLKANASVSSKSQYETEFLSWDGNVYIYYFPWLGSLDK